MSLMADTILLRLKEQVTLYRTPEKDVYVGYQSPWGPEVVASNSKRFYDWMRSQMLGLYQMSVSTGDCKLVAETLAAAALNTPAIEERRVYTRVGWHKESQTLYINLANDLHQLVGIRAGVAPFLVGPDEVPLLFHFADKAKPLPVPLGLADRALPAPQAPADGETGAPNETLDALMARVLPPRTKPYQRVLMIAWLLGALHPTGPYPILALGGEPGSAKSFTCRLLRRIVDPAKPDLLSGVTDSRNLAVAAKHNYCLAFDNLGKLDKKQSDILCRLATGAGIARRSLYTDEELHTLEVKRPVLLNGIAEVITEADLLDRSIQIHLPRLAEGDRRPEMELWAQFQASLPAILGQLYRAVAQALANLETVVMPQASVPRMLDFARFVLAAESAIGWEPGTFLQAFEASREEAMEQAITASFPAQALIRWMQGRERAHRATGAPVAWHGTAQELHKELDAIVRKHAKGVPDADWPRKATVLMRHLQTAATPLRRLGLDLERRTETKARLHITYITPKGVTLWQTFPTFAGKGLAHERGDQGETSFRVAYARRDPVTTENRALLQRAGYSDEQVDGLTNQLAREILRAFQQAGMDREDYEGVYAQAGGDDAA
jgi:hypothetical protein